MPPSVDWSGLNIDILSLIFDKLFVLDSIRFGAVCTQWHLLFELKRKNPPLNPSPCLYMGDIDDKVKLYSVVDDAHIQFPVRVEPNMSSRLILGSNNGWLFTIDTSCNLQLIRPISGVHHDLLPVTVLPSIEPVFDSQGRFEAYYSVWNNLDRHKLSYNMLFTRANVSADLTVMMTDQNDESLLFTRVGHDQSWTLLRGPEDYNDDEDHEFHGIIVCKDMFHTIDTMGEMYAWVPKGHSFEARLVGPRFYEAGSEDFLRFTKDNPGFLVDPGMVQGNFYPYKGPLYLVESSDGLGLMLVLEVLTFDYEPVLRVVRWHEEEGKWKHVESLGEDSTLFVACCQPFYVSRDEFEKNSIYFNGGDSGVFSMREKSHKEIFQHC